MSVIWALCSKCWAKQLFMGLLTNKTVKRKHLIGNLHFILETKLNPPILNNLHSSLWSLCSGSSLKVNYIFLFQFFTHHFNYSVGNFIFDAHFSCSPVPAPIFWELWDLAGNDNSTGWLLRKKSMVKECSIRLCFWQGFFNRFWLRLG